MAIISANMSALRVAYESAFASKVVSRQYYLTVISFTVNTADEKRK